ncbi:universal stress protein [Variovorax sp. Sphag1AA]|uniref:universal stress protein n=1 Tax=Variovorax sp. Sphag1AA TaxID=2587027 RepID=UPI0016106F65|nr:universal stress protein [Variovorax sp. Sphag1AA]MBB3176821.1 nucleotide-binding universal stress UspA family protein [Variovorax sp. Sphag1AA]
MYQRILVPVDGSPVSNRGLDEAVRLAKLTQGRLRLVHVIDELSLALAMDAQSGRAGSYLQSVRDDGARVLEDAKRSVVAAGIEVETSLHERYSPTVYPAVIAESSVDDIVIAEATQWKADLIVLGTHGRRGVSRLVMGSSAERIVRRAPVPILLVRASDEDKQIHAKEEVVRIHQPTGALAFE